VSMKAGEMKGRLGRGAVVQYWGWISASSEWNEFLVFLVRREMLDEMLVKLLVSDS
jgi:hypothetical protein